VSARETILAAVRAATGGAAFGREPLPDYLRSSQDDRSEMLQIFEQRLTDYNVGVQVIGGADDIGGAVAARLAERGLTVVVVPDDLPQAWRPAGITVLEDSRCSLRDLNATPAVVTGARMAIAQTGTVVLDAGPGQGRRALTLLPDYHLCVVFASQVVDLVPAALEALRPSIQARAPITFFSGPSATADIEFDRVVGVHGPRTLDVLLVED
jgi:L-lactate dehydrogenase complex protein LldG